LGFEIFKTDFFDFDLELVFIILLFFKRKTIHPFYKLSLDKYLKYFQFLANKIQLKNICIRA